MADELRQQVPVIKEVLQAMGVKTIEKRVWKPMIYLERLQKDVRRWAWKCL